MIHLRLLGGVELSAREGGSDRRLTMAPKPLALLAYLAVAKAHAKRVRRDVLVALFWPELPTERARGALRQLLFQLRRALGAKALNADRDTVSLSADALSCDVAEFEERLARGDHVGAMEVYGGALLEGFFVDGVSGALEEWIDGERERLKWKAFLACRTLADEGERSGNGTAAAQWARAAVALAPDNEVAVRRLIEILDAFGDRAGALRAADVWTRRLSKEFGAAPSAETQALIAAVRGRGQSAGGFVPDEAYASERGIATSSVAPRSSVYDMVRSSHRAHRRSLIALTTALVLTAGGSALLVTRAGVGATPDGGRTRAVSPPVTITSPVARPLYAEALKRYFAGDLRESTRLFGAALAEDSSCAMCAYYAAQAYSGFDDAAAGRMMQVAMRLASRVSVAERLLIRYHWADATNSKTRGAAAESLVAHYPNWPEAQIAAAQAAAMDAHWLASASHLRRALAIASPADSASGLRCPVCSAETDLYNTYEAADSIRAAVRVAKSWVHAQPHSRVAWLLLSHALAESGQYDEARAAIDTSTRYSTEASDDAIEHAQIEIRAGNFDVADRLLTTLAETGNANTRTNALWFLVISLRAQGRLHEALHVADGPLQRAEAAATHGSGNHTVADAQVLFDLGEYRRAAAAFESLAWPLDSFSRASVGRIARQHAWFLSHAGSAMAAAGDTVAVARLADSVKAWGSQSGFERDRRLHEYLRGLLWAARSQPESSAVAFRKAITSETQGFSLLNLQLARNLLALGRPREAIPLLQHPLAGTLEGGNFYATRTELQEELARAFDAVGEPDSAAVYNHAVISAWHAADPEFHERVMAARARLEADQRRIAAQH